GTRGPRRSRRLLQVGARARGREGATAHGPHPVPFLTGERPRAGRQGRQGHHAARVPTGGAGDAATGAPEDRGASGGTPCGRAPATGPPAHAACTGVARAGRVADLLVVGLALKR